MQRFGQPVKLAPIRTTTTGEWPRADATANPDGFRFLDGAGTVRSVDTAGSTVPRATSASGEGLGSLVVSPSILPVVYYPCFGANAAILSLNPLIGAVIAVMVYELLVDVWHRTMHRVHWLRGSFHQVHHSAERLDSYGAFYSARWTSWASHSRVRTSTLR